MRISKESKDKLRARWIFYKEFGGTDEFTSYVLFLEDIFLELSKENKLPQSTQNEIVAYIDRVCETLGIPLPEGAPWEPVNVRGPYQCTVPGMISEMIAPYNLYPTYPLIVHPQDEHTQRFQMIDLFVNGRSVQVKTVVCNGSTLWIDPLWLQGQAEFLSLVDIDDQEHWFVPRNDLMQYANLEINTEWELKPICTHYFYNFKKYPRWD